MNKFNSRREWYHRDLFVLLRQGTHHSSSDTRRGGIEKIESKEDFIVRVQSLLIYVVSFIHRLSLND